MSLYYSGMEYGTVFPKYQLVYQGGTAIIFCKGLNVSWTHNSKLLLTTTKHKHYEVLILYDVSTKHSSNYKCTGKLKNGTSFEKEADVLIGGKHWH